MSQAALIEAIAKIAQWEAHLESLDAVIESSLPISAFWQLCSTYPRPSFVPTLSQPPTRP